MSEYWAYKSPSELYLKTGDVTAGPLQFRSDSYHAGRPLFGVPVPCKIAGCVVEPTEDQVANAKRIIAKSWIVPHSSVVGAYQVVEVEGSCPGGIPLGSILSLLPLDAAIAKGYHVYGSPSPSPSDRLTQVTA